MSFSGFDTAEVTTGHAHEILDAGYSVVGGYLREDRFPLEMIQGLVSVGIRLFSIWEKGNPTEPDYFTADQGTSDGTHAAAYAKEIGQPEGTMIFVSVDCDASPDDISDYVQAAHTAVKEGGYLMGLYGSGQNLGHFQDAGFSHAGFLAQSKGWSGYEDYKPRAAIVQGESTTVLGFGVDLDTIMDESVLWTLPSGS
jgi:hypothetical protein